jgi:hypothetical protein
MFLKKRVAQKLPARATRETLSKEKRNIFKSIDKSRSLLLSSLFSPNHQIERISPFFEKKKKRERELSCDDDEKKNKKKRDKIKKNAPPSRAAAAAFKKPLPLLLKLLLLLLHLLDALVLLCVVAVDDEAVVEESVIIIFYFYEKWIFPFSLSFILSFLLKMVEEEGRKILSLFSLFLFSTQQARARTETRSLWDEALERRSASGLSSGKESRSEPDGGSFSLARRSLSFSLGERKKNCVKDMRVHVTSSFLFCLGFYNKP